MQKGIVYLLLLDFFSVTFQISVKKEVTIPVSSPIQLKCDNDLKLNNIEVTIRRINSSCFASSEDCILPQHAIETIKEICNEQVSCEVDIRNITNNHECLYDYGYANISYTCKTIAHFSCDFEDDWCNWSPSQRYYNFYWDRGWEYPYVDHTTASAAGTFVYIRDVHSKEGDIAKLESAYITASDNKCLAFWYFTTNSRDSVHVLQNEMEILQISHYDHNKWHRVQIPLKTKSYHPYNMDKLVFKVTRGGKYGSFGAIIIDDILIDNQKCNSSVLECDFETSSCGWTNDYSNQQVWRKQNGQFANETTGPLTDHSTASGSGFYMYMSKPSRKQTTTKYFGFKNLNLTLSRRSCLTFWYQIVYQKAVLRVKIGDNLVSKIIGNQVFNQWIKATINLDIIKVPNIKFIGNIRGNWEGGLAIDETEGTCTGLIDHKEICVDLNDDASKETYCPKGYLNFTNAGLSFDPERNECSDQYKKTRARIVQECKDEDDESQKCAIDLSTDISAKPECFQLHEFRIRHACKGTTIDTTKADDTTTVLSEISSKDDLIAAYKSTTVVTSVRDSAEESTTISQAVTSIRDEGAVTVKSAPLPTNVDGSSDSEIGLVAGLVVAGLLIICLVILIVYLVIRHLNRHDRRGSNDKVRNELRENDYIGCQDIALSQTAGCSNHMQNVDMYGQRSSTNTTNDTQINNVQHTCSNLGTHKEVQSPPYTVRRDDTFADNQMSNGDEYAMVGPIAETSFSKTIKSRTGTPNSVQLSEPTVTGLNRTQLLKMSTGYEFAKPVLDTENKLDDEDQYALSEEGVYDYSGNNRHKELEDNIYNHAVDNIYDSGTHKRNEDDKEDTYDHFFGQKTEDDYDITTTT